MTTTELIRPEVKKESRDSTLKHLLRLTLGRQLPEKTLMRLTQAGQWAPSDIETANGMPLTRYFRTNEGILREYITFASRTANYPIKSASYAPIRVYGLTFILESHEFRYYNSEGKMIRRQSNSNISSIYQASGHPKIKECIYDPPGRIFGKPVPPAPPMTTLRSL